MAVKTIILAAGTQERFGNFPDLKQFLVIDGERIIDRAIRLGRAFGDDFTIMAHNKKLQIPGPTFAIPEKRKTTCHTLLSSSALWGEERTVILLGDVYYTAEAIETIYSCKRAFQFFTDTGDFFAITIHKGNYEWFKEFVRATLARWAKENMMTCPILEVYREMGLPEHLCTYIGDETQDFDRMCEYTEFLRGKSKNRLYKK